MTLDADVSTIFEDYIIQNSVSSENKRNMGRAGFEREKLVIVRRYH